MASKNTWLKVVIVIGILVFALNYLGVFTFSQYAEFAPDTETVGGAVEGPFRIDGNQKNATVTSGGALDNVESCTYLMYVQGAGGEWVYVSSSGAKTASFTGSSNGWSVAAKNLGSGESGHYAIFFESTAAYPMLDEIVANNQGLVATERGFNGQIFDEGPDDDGKVELGVWFHFEEMAGDENEVYLINFNWLPEDSAFSEGGNPANNTNVNSVSADVTRTAIFRLDISNEYEGVFVKNLFIKINESDKSIVYVESFDADRAEEHIDTESPEEVQFQSEYRYYAIKDATAQDGIYLHRGDGESGYIYITVTLKYIVSFVKIQVELSGASDGDMFRITKHTVNDISITLVCDYFSDAYFESTTAVTDQIEDTI